MQSAPQAAPLAAPAALSFDRLKDRFWKFFHRHGAVASEFFKFLPDGTVGGYHHANERYWRLDNGILSLLNEDRIVTVTFDIVERHGDGITFIGRHLPDPAITLCLKEQSGRIKHSETRRALSREIETLGWSIGEHTYGIPVFYEKGQARLTIGKYCSISGNVVIAFADHRLDSFTTYPFKALKEYWEHVPPGADDHASKGDITIGHDVWIGEGAFIGSGTTIGTGAVIGAKSVIVRNIPPYAIVVGNPARIVRYRFDPIMIGQLLRLAWWDLSDECVDSLLPLLMSTDAPALLTALNRARA